MSSPRSVMTELATAGRSLIRSKTDRRTFWLFLSSLVIMGMLLRLETRVTALSIAMEAYADRFYARDRQRAVVLTPQALIFKLKGYPSFRLSIRKHANRLELYVRDPRVAPKRTSR